MMVFNRDGRVFVGNDRSDSGSLAVAPSGIDAGEEPRTAALRELKERDRHGKRRVPARTSEWLTYDLPANLIGIVCKDAIAAKG